MEQSSYSIALYCTHSFKDIWWQCSHKIFNMKILNGKYSGAVLWINLFTLWNIMMKFFNTKFFNIHFVHWIIKMPSIAWLHLIWNHAGGNFTKNTNRRRFRDNKALLLWLIMILLKLLYIHVCTCTWKGSYTYYVSRWPFFVTFQTNESISKTIKP